LLSSWPEQFIPEQISANVTPLQGSDHNEREGYVANLESDNFENDLQAISEDITSENNTMFASGSLSTDLDGNKVNNDQQLLETIASFVNGDQAETEEHESETREDDNNIIDDDRNFALDDSMTSGDSENITNTSCRRNYIRYSCNTKTSTLSSAWKDPLFFITAFPTLFPTGLGGHLDERPIKVSLEAYAKWALSHHSRK
jgi:hypothetical protein